MTALVVVEAACIFLLGLLVVGLLRSHAEILRQLHDLGVGRDEGLASPVAVEVAVGGSTGSPAHDLAGQTPGGEAVAVAVAAAPQDTLLAFLSSGCLTCAGFWEALAAPGTLGLPPNTRVIAVTKSSGDESASAVGQLAPGGRTVVMSTQSWLDYGVPGSPYFVHVNGPSGRVVGEGSAGKWEQVVSLVARASEDRLAAQAGSGQGDHRPEGGDGREVHDGHDGRDVRDVREVRDVRDRSRIDRELTAAGIAPGDAALYPTSAPVTGDDR